MSFFYHISGKMVVSTKERDEHGQPKAQALLDALIATASGDNLEVEFDDDPTHPHCLHIRVEGATECSYTSAGEIDTALLAFGPYVITPAKFQTHSDEGDEDLWVGEPDEIKVAIRMETMKTIATMLVDLLTEGTTIPDSDKAELLVGIEEMMDHMYDECRKFIPAKYLPVPLNLPPNLPPYT